MAQFEWPSLILSGWTDGHHENPVFSPNFEPGSPEYNAEVLPKILRPSVQVPECSNGVPESEIHFSQIDRTEAFALLGCSKRPRFLVQK